MKKDLSIERDNLITLLKEHLSIDVTQYSYTDQIKIQLSWNEKDSSDLIQQTVISYDYINL